MSNILHKTVIESQIRLLESDSVLLERFSTDLGFFYFFYENLGRYGSAEIGFFHCNKVHEGLFGEKRYENLEDFKLGKRSLTKINSNTDASLVSAKSSEILMQDFLIQWFKEKGFVTYESFAMIVSHLYPQINFQQLSSFYVKEFCSKQILTYVDWSRQILDK